MTMTVNRRLSPCVIRHTSPSLCVPPASLMRVRACVFADAPASD